VFDLGATSFALLGVILGAASAAAVLGASRRAPTPVPAAALEARVLELETMLPRYRVEMADLADRAEDLLGRAEAKRRSAKTSEQRATEAGAAEPPPTDRGSRKVALRRAAGMI